MQDFRCNKGRDCNKCKLNLRVTNAFGDKDWCALAQSEEYQEFDSMCHQKGLFEVFRTSNRDAFDWMTGVLEESGRKYQRFGDVWGCRFEIRFR